MGFGVSINGLKWIKKRQRYEMSTQNNWFDPETMIAKSYNWWVYFKVINGKNIFNNYSYSQSTNAHQSDLKYLLKELGIKIDATVSQRESLCSGIDLEPYYRNIFQLEIEIKRKGSKKATNKERKHSIEKNKQTIRELRKLGGKFSNTEKAELKKRLVKNEKQRIQNLKDHKQKVKAASSECKAELKSLESIDFSMEQNINSLNAI